MTEADAPGWRAQPHAVVERDGVRYTLLGTAHVSSSSVDAVREAIASGDFDSVAVELDPHRLQSLADPGAVARLDLVQVLREGKAALFAANLGLAAYQRRLAELLGEAPLVGGQREVSGDQPGLSFSQYLEQVQLRQRVRVGKRAVALRIELDRDGVVVAAGDFRFYCIDAGARYVRGAEQRVVHAVAFDEQVRLVMQGAGGARVGDVQSRYRLSRSW